MKKLLFLLLIFTRNQLGNVVVVVITIIIILFKSLKISSILLPLPPTFYFTHVYFFFLHVKWISFKSV